MSEYKSELYFSDPIKETVEFSISHASLASKLVQELESVYFDLNERVSKWEADGIVNIMSSISYATFKEHTNIGITLSGTKEWSEEKAKAFKEGIAASKKEAEQAAKENKTEDGSLDQLKSLVMQHPDATVKFLLAHLGSKK